MSSSIIPVPVRIEINGTAYELKRLSNYDRGELLNKKYAAQRVLLVENLKAAGITTGPEYFQTLQEFDSIERNVNDEWIAFCNDGRTDYDVIRTSIGKTIKAEGLADELAKEATLTFAEKAQVCGLVVEYKKPPADLPPDGINPETGRPFSYGDSSTEEATKAPETSDPNAST